MAQAIRDLVKSMQDNSKSSPAPPKIGLLSNAQSSQSQANPSALLINYKYKKLVEATGYSQESIDQKCKKSTVTQDWCDYFESLLEDVNTNPPSSPFEDSLSDILYYVVSSLKNPPKQLLGILQGKKAAPEILQSLGSKAADNLNEMLKNISQGKEKAAAAQGEDLVKSLYSAIKTYNLNPDVVVSNVSSMFSKKAVVPISTDDLSKTLSKAISKLQSTGDAAAASLELIGALKSKVPQGGSMDLKGMEIKNVTPNGSSASQPQIEVGQKQAVNRL